MSLLTPEKVYICTLRRRFTSALPKVDLGKGEEVYTVFVERNLHIACVTNWSGPIFFVPPDMLEPDETLQRAQPLPERGVGASWPTTRLAEAKDQFAVAARALNRARALNAIDEIASEQSIPIEYFDAHRHHLWSEEDVDSFAEKYHLMRAKIDDYQPFAESPPDFVPPPFDRWTSPAVISEAIDLHIQAVALAAEEQARRKDHENVPPTHPDPADNSDVEKPWQLGAIKKLMEAGLRSELAKSKISAIVGDDNRDALLDEFLEWLKTDEMLPPSVSSEQPASAESSTQERDRALRVINDIMRASREGAARVSTGMITNDFIASVFPLWSMEEFPYHAWRTFYLAEVARRDAARELPGQVNSLYKKDGSLKQLAQREDPRSSRPPLNPWDYIGSGAILQDLALFPGDAARALQGVAEAAPIAIGGVLEAVAAGARKSVNAVAGVSEAVVQPVRRANRGLLREQLDTLDTLDMSVHGLTRGAAGPPPPAEQADEWIFDGGLPRDISRTAFRVSTSVLGVTQAILDGVGGLSEWFAFAS